MKRLFHGNWLLHSTIILIVSISISCDRDFFHEGKPGSFFFSSDTVMFDTIFTDFGTPTCKILVHNTNNFSIRFDSIYLGKSQGDFIININGNTRLPLKNITLEPNDSLYIFIQAFIPSSRQDEVFIREDSLVFTSGDQTRNVKLIAFGQNVISFRDEHIQSQEWLNTKPYLVFGTLTVDSAAILRVHEGVRVYFHRNARLHIKGTLLVSGTYAHPVIFRNDRLEKEYDSIPGQWGGIVLSGTEEKHSIHSAIIRNAVTGLQTGDPAGNRLVKAEIANTIIANMSYAAMTAYQTNLSAQNCVFANAGNSVCALYGGDYSFLHCTLANYNPSYMMRSSGSKTLLAGNTSGNTSSPQHAMNAYFGNCIIYGNYSEEIALLHSNDAPIQCIFENCLLKTSPSLVANHQNIYNESPGFLRPENENFRLDTLSSAIDAGNTGIGNLVPNDLDNHNRTGDRAPDAGAYEMEVRK